MEKRITLEENFTRLNNCINAINSLINYESFSSFGRYAYAYGKNYNGGNMARHQVRRTLKSALRLIKVIHMQINTDDISELKKSLNYQTEILKIQQILM